MTCSVASLKKIIALTVFCLSMTLGSLLEVKAQEADLVINVPEDVYLYVQVDQFQKRVEELKKSGLAERALKQMVVQSWLRGPQFKGVGQLVQAVKEVSGRPFEDVLNDFTGEQSILALCKIEGVNKPSTVFLTRTKSREFVDDLIKSWNQFDTPKITKHSHKGIEYTQRSLLDEKGEPKETVFYIIENRDLMLVEHESTIREMIEMRASKNSIQHLAENSFFKKWRSNWNKELGVRILLNPKLIGSPKNVKPEDELFFAPILSLWNDSQFVSMSLDFREGFVLNAVAHNDKKDWSESPKLEEIDSLANISKDSFLFVAGNSSWEPAAKWLNSMMDKNDREAFKFQRAMQGIFQGKDLLKGILARMGPQWSVAITLNPERRLLPLDADIVVEIPQSDSSPENGCKNAINNALSTGLNVLCFVYNHEIPDLPVANVQSNQSESKMSKWAGKLIDWTVGYTIQSNQLHISSHYKKEDFSRSDSILTDAHFQKWSEKYVPNSTSLVWFDTLKLRESVVKHRDAIVNSVAKMNRQDPKQTRRKLSRFNDLLYLFDAMFASVQTKPNEFHFTIGGVID